MDKPAAGSPASDIAHRTEGIYSEEAMAFATSLLESSNDLVAAIDPGLHMVAMNAAFRREFELVFGISLTAGQRLDAALAHVVADRDKVISLCRRAFGGESFRVIEDFGDHHLLRKTYELSFSPIFDTQRRAIFAAVVVRDLTLIRVSEQRFGALLEAAPDATIITRSDGSIELANAHAERMFGYGRNGLLGLRIEDLIPERLRARHIAQRHLYAVRSSARSMGSGSGHLLGLRADGTEFPVEISLNPIEAGNDSLVVAAIRDMTLRQRTEDELRAVSAELERRVAERTAELERMHEAFRAIFEHASVGIAQVTTSGEWIRVNQTLCDMVGYSQEELQTLTFQDITHPDDLDNDLRLMYRLLAGNIQTYSMDKRYIKKDGDVIWISLSVSLVRDKFGAPEYFVSVIKDISERKGIEADLQTSMTNLELAIFATGLGLFDFYPQTGQVDWSREMKRQFGFGHDEKVTYESFLQHIHPHDRARVDADVKAAMRGDANGQFHHEYRILRGDDGEQRWIEARGKVYFDALHQAVRCIGTALDITEKKHAEESVRESAQQLKAMFDANPVGTVRRKASGEIVDANDAFLRIVGLAREDLAAGHLRWDDLTPPEHLDADRRAMQQASERGVSEIFEKEYLRADGERVPVMLAFAAIPQGEYVGFALDISERKRAEEQIRQAGMHDPLTSLPNRALLYEYARHCFGRAQRENNHCAILYIDLDRFKPINDTYGHEVGDCVLAEAASRIRSTTRLGDIVFRMGGDEFLVMLQDVDNDTNAQDVAHHMLDRIASPYAVSGLELNLSASVGISIYPRDGEDIDTLMNNADAAMYQAKQQGRAGVRFYSKELAERAQRQAWMEAQLKKALAHETFELYYQPVVDIRSSRLVSVEALVRWPHKDIGPDQFVPIAEATGQINRLSEWVIVEACRQRNEWCEHGLPPIPVAVNISAVLLRQQDFAEAFSSLVAGCSSQMDALHVEVTETALMENLDRAIDILTRLREMGVEVALDDFGTGYSSLNYLSRLPINKIKVDKSFVQRIESDKASRAITQAVIALGRTLKLEVIAEGIESEKALQYLRRHGCSQAQGFHVCRPVSARAFEQWYAQRCVH